MNRKRKAVWNMKKRGRPRGSDWIVLKALERAPLTFEELCKATGLSRSIVSAKLKELEKMGKIERFPLPPSGGKGRYRLKIQLVNDTPEERVLRHLFYPLPSLDFEKGKEYLTPQVSDALLTISSLELRESFPRYSPPRRDCVHHPFFVCWRDEYLDSWEKDVRIVVKTKTPEAEIEKLLEKLERTKEGEEAEKVFHKIVVLRSLSPHAPELDPSRPPWVRLKTIDFLKGLAAFNIELNTLVDLEGGIPPELLRNFPLEEAEKLRVALARGKNDPKLFPAMGVAERTNTKEQMIALLNWLRPVLEGGEPLWTEEEVRSFPPKTAKLLSRRGVFVVEEDNLVSELFSRLEREYSCRVLLPAWYSIILKKSPRDVYGGMRGVKP